VKYEAVEVVTLSKSREVLACLRRVVVVQFDDNSTLLLLVGSRVLRERMLTIVVSSATSVAMVSGGARQAGLLLRTVMVELVAKEKSTHGPSMHQPHLRHAH
jgi:hypothetical protein